MLPAAVLRYGSQDSLPEQIPLRAGPLTLIYEAGDLRYIRLGEREIMRRIYAAVRDRNWGTAPAVLSNVQMETGADHFTIEYDVHNRLGEIDFTWHGTLTGDAAGTLRFQLDGRAHSTFWRNRLGFCVLHPDTCAGARARVEHVDGAVDETRFPEAIAPQLVIDGLIKPVSPFEEMAAVSHEVQPGLWARLEFEGEIFETEDQRNWTDASFKTYCTPLRLPFPAEVPAGAEIHQAVTLRLNGRIPAVVAAEEGAVSVTLDAAPARPLPTLGLALAHHGQPLSRREIERLAALRPAQLRVELRLWQPDWSAALAHAAGEAGALGCTLIAAVFVSADAETELERLAETVRTQRAPVTTWLFFDRRGVFTDPAVIALARRLLASLAGGARIGGGTDAFFTELNRARPAAGLLDIVGYTLNPQVHAFDHSSLVETLAAQAATVASARRFLGDLPLIVGPVTLRMRSNPNATGPQSPPAPGELPPQVDVRQMSLFGAGWTLGSFKVLAESDVQHLIYYETTGARGVMETEAGSVLPERFPSLPGAVFPLYHVLAAIGDFAGGEIVAARSSRPLAVEVLALHKDGRRRLLLASFRPEAQTIQVLGVSGAARIRSLDETSAEAAMRDPEGFRSGPGRSHTAKDGRLALTLPPLGVLILDLQ